MENMRTVELPNATLIHGDCVEGAKMLPDDSLDFSVWSPPFPELYTYSNDPRDMGNCRSYDEFEWHISYLFPEVYRVMREGKNVAIHCMDIPIQKGKHGYIGLRDFSGLLIKMMENVGFIYHSRITIWKNPVVEMQRTKALGLLHKQVKKDSTMSRVGIPDYVLVFRKDGNRDNPVKCPITVDQWQEYASPVWQFDNITKDVEMILPLISEEAFSSLPANVLQKYIKPVWMDIDYSKTLNAAIAREDKDEKHICPLQLDTIERLNILYTNPGDTVGTFFGGIGSEPYQCVLMGRKAVAFELKKSYFDTMVKNVKNAHLILQSKTLF